ncbi:hypothetical protein B296_00024728 [Ensete ventricosum]|uniref:Uncharacterized protein n=1 Tax=Ensete ventricosum TaxID=4639 RepID=A0A427ABB0_ENSVE|nr:hypothetical protein B296_00024728 [Ensete ventricosum]
MLKMSWPETVSSRSRGRYGGSEHPKWRYGPGGWKGGRVTLGRGDRTIEEVEQPQKKSTADWRVSARDAIATKRRKGSHNRCMPPGTAEGGEAAGQSDHRSVLREDAGNRPFQQIRETTGKVEKEFSAEKISEDTRMQQLYSATQWRPAHCGFFWLRQKEQRRVGRSLRLLRPGRLQGRSTTSRVATEGEGNNCVVGEATTVAGEAECYGRNDEGYSSGQRGCWEGGLRPRGEEGEDAVVAGEMVAEGEGSGCG